MSTNTAVATTSRTTTARKAVQAEPKARTLPWEDLAPNVELQKEPREKTTMSAVLGLLRERKNEGAKLEELQKAVDSLSLSGTHEVRQLMRWMNANRGWGFHQKKDGNIVLIVSEKK